MSVCGLTRTLLPVRRCHIFYSQRVVDIHDGKPKWSKLDGKSELIKELGREDEKDNTVVGAPRNENTNN